jgi:hypothetical protein
LPSFGGRGADAKENFVIIYKFAGKIADAIDAIYADA